MLLWTINSRHPKSTLSYRKLAKRSAFSEETYISFRLPLAVFSTWQSFNRTLSMQLQQRYLSCPLLCVIASVLCGGGQCAVSPGDWQAEVAPILKNHRLTSIEHRWALQFAVVVRRCVQKSAPLSLCTRLSFTEHSHQTRGSGNSLRPFCPSSRPGMLSFTNRAPLVWNSLPARPSATFKLSLVEPPPLHFLSQLEYPRGAFLVRHFSSSTLTTPRKCCRVA